MEIGLADVPHEEPFLIAEPHASGFHSPSLHFELDRKSSEIQSLKETIRHLRKSSRAKLSEVRTRLKRRTSRFRQLETEWTRKEETLQARISRLEDDKQKQQQQAEEKSFSDVDVGLPTASDVDADSPVTSSHTELLIALLGKMKSSLSRVQSENQKLRSSNSTYESNFRSLQQHLRATSSHLEERLSEMKSASVERHTLRNQIVRLEGELKVRDDAVEKADCRVSEIQRQVDEEQASNRGLLTTIDNHKREMCVLQARTEEAELRCEECRQRRLEAENAARKAREDFLSQKDLLLRQQRALEAAERKHDSEVPKLETRLKDANEEILRLNRLLAESNVRLAEEAKRREVELTGLSRQMADERARLQSRLDVGDRRNKDLEDDLCRTRSQLSTSGFIDETKAKEVETERLRAENRELAVGNAGLLEKVESLREQKHRAIHDLDVSRRVGDKLKRRLKVCTRQYEEVVKLHQRNQVEFAELQGMLEALENQRSSRLPAAQAASEAGLRQAFRSDIPSSLAREFDAAAQDLEDVVVDAVPDAIDPLATPGLSPVVLRPTQTELAPVPDPARSSAETSSGDDDVVSEASDSDGELPSPVVVEPVQAPRRPRRRRGLNGRRSRGQRRGRRSFGNRKKKIHPESEKQ